MYKTIKCIAVEPNKDAYLIAINANDYNLMSFVGGYTMSVPSHDNDIIFICNNAYSRYQLPRCRVVDTADGSFPIYGRFLICSPDLNSDLPDELIEKYTNMMNAREA